jgi:hypothetical protein
MRHRNAATQVAENQPTSAVPQTPVPAAPPAVDTGAAATTPAVDPNASTTTPAVPEPTVTGATTEPPPSAPPKIPKEKPVSKKVAAPVVTAPAAVATKGDLTIVTTPAGATVTMDGKRLNGVTPLTEKDVPAGKHTLQVAANGYLSATRPVEITNGAATTATIPLVASQGKVKVSSVPPGAEIFVDGAAVNKKTPSEFTLGKGDHTFAVRMQGYEEAGDLIHVNPGDALTFAPTLSVARKGDANPFKKVGKFFAGDEKGALSVTTEPAGAFVFINGRRLPGQTPLSTPAPVGHLSMAIRKPGFAPVQKAVTVEKGKTAKLAIPLTPAKED